MNRVITLFGSRIYRILSRICGAIDSTSIKIHQHHQRFQSHRNVTRDLGDLVEKECLYHLEGGGRNARYGVDLG
jgi:hypothetical protein